MCVCVCVCVCVWLVVFVFVVLLFFLLFLSLPPPPFFSLCLCLSVCLSVSLSLSLYFFFFFFFFLFFCFFCCCFFAAAVWASDSRSPQNHVLTAKTNEVSLKPTTLYSSLGEGGGGEREINKNQSLLKRERNSIFADIGIDYTNRDRFQCHYAHEYHRQPSQNTLTRAFVVSAGCSLKSRTTERSCSFSVCLPPCVCRFLQDWSRARPPTSCGRPTGGAAWRCSRQARRGSTSPRPASVSDPGRQHASPPSVSTVLSASPPPLMDHFVCRWPSWPPGVVVYVGLFVSTVDRLGHQTL